MTQLGEYQPMISLSIKRLLRLVAQSALVAMLLLPLPLLLSIIFAKPELKHDGLLNSDDHVVFRDNTLSLFSFSKSNNLLSHSPKLEPIVYGLSNRRLLSVLSLKKETLDGLEDVLLEPPVVGSRKMKNSKRIRFLPNLIGDSLDNYPRRVFIDVGPPDRANSKNWFKKNYPKGKLDFEMVRLDIVVSDNKVARVQETSDWLRTNVKKEDYVVMKAEADEVEEMIKGRAIGLVDELFLECENQWFKGTKSTRAYWECLALYGRLRDEGIAVHQWWG